MSMGGKGIGSTIAPATVTVPGGSTLTKYIKDLVVERLNVTSEFTFNGHKVKWREFRILTDIKSGADNGDLKYYYRNIYTLCGWSGFEGSHTVTVYKGSTGGTTTS